MECESQKSNALPECGVGITYSTELDPILLPGLVDVIEIEPQTLWVNHAGKFSMPTEVVTHVQSLPFKKLIHSVGLPVGGTFRGTQQEINLLMQNIEDFKSPWASEHLGFNMTSEFHTGFFLPPRQTDEGIERCVQSINLLQHQLQVPFAVETGVNYLKPRANEISDGAFIQRVISTAQCGLLLDLHNLYANELNGRQSIENFLKEIDTTKVLEIHLAGGMEMDGFWLDAHSGQMPKQLIDIAMSVVPHLPNLRAIVYEVLPSYLPHVGLKKIEEELIIVRKIWDTRRVSHDTTFVFKTEPATPAADQYNDDWEETLGALAIGHNPHSDRFILTAEPGVEIIRKLVNEFRASMLVSVFKLTSRFIMLSMGVDVFKTILNEFWREYPPKQYGSEEALHFSEFLRKVNFQFPNLYSLLDFEEATLRTLLDNQTRVVTFDHDPFPLLKSLAAGRLETMERQAGMYEIEITGDTPDDEMWKLLSRPNTTGH